jgi:membrane protein implicated in regulation of membrane protease activity
LALVAGFVLFALIDPPLGVAFLVAGALIEVGEATFWYRYLKRIRIRTGVEAMPGRRAEVIEPCNPRGQVKLDGEIWTAECPEGAAGGETVEVVAVEGLTLVVRRV